jgi:hypothetical protein
VCLEIQRRCHMRGASLHDQCLRFSWHEHRAIRARCGFGECQAADVKTGRTTDDNARKKLRNVRGDSSLSRLAGPLLPE